MKLQHFIESMCENNNIKYKDFLTTLGTFYKMGLLKLIYCNGHSINYEKAYKYLMNYWNNENIPFSLDNLNFYLNILNNTRSETLSINKIISNNFNVRPYIKDINRSKQFVYEFLYIRDRNLIHTNKSIFTSGKIPDSLLDFTQRMVEAGFRDNAYEILKSEFLFGIEDVIQFSKKLLNYIKQYLREHHEEFSKEDLIHQLTCINMYVILHELKVKTGNCKEDLYRFLNKDYSLDKEVVTFYTNTLHTVLEEYIESHLVKPKKDYL